MKYILWIIIILAVVLVFIKKVRDFRKGKFCDCGCDGCEVKCGRKKEFKD